MYKAVSNPAYICQTENDPILKAFELSIELNREATFDKEFYLDYKALSKVSIVIHSHMICKSYKLIIIMNLYH